MVITVVWIHLKQKIMKKLFLMGLMLSGIALTTTAQTNMDPKFGIKAGANLMMGGKFEIAGTAYTSKYAPGFQAGVFLDLPLSETLSFMPEVLYTQKGSKFEETIAGTTGEIKTKIGYVDVPVLLGINASPQLQFVIGPQASILTNQKTTSYVNGAQTASSTDKNDFRKAIAGGVVGLGYKINSNVNLNARYSMDFQSVANDNINQDKARLSGFALSLGYSF